MGNIEGRPDQASDTLASNSKHRHQDENSKPLKQLTQTVTSTNIIVKTQATTVTSGATTTTLTNTQTNTETVEEGSAFGIYAIILAVIAIILLGLAVRQQRKDMFPF